jgi:hypothetical protein
MEAALGAVNARVTRRATGAGPVLIASPLAAT